MSRRVLIVEDDPAMARLLRDNLEFEGFQVECAGDAETALARCQTFRPGLLLLDLMLPRQDGFHVCRELAERRERPPIIVLSARSQKEDKVRALNLGADDYVTKPFDLDELLARVRAVLRRGESKLDRLRLGEVTIDFHKREASRQGAALALSHRELQVLRYLAERPGRLVSRDELLQAVWGYRDAPITRAVDVSIARLRRKIEPDPQRPRYIRTLHGDGYCLTP